MTISESSTLSALIAAYDEAVVFEGSAPAAYQLAKLFMKMRSSNGGLVLLGVREDGEVVGIGQQDVTRIYLRFEKLCAELTRSSVEIGTLRLKGNLVVFLVFNTVSRNLEPLEQYSGSIERVECI